MIGTRRIVLIFACGFLALGLVGCRFHEVDKGKFYRGPQPTLTELDTAITKYGLKTIINLRGENPGSDWYEEEESIARSHGVKLINIGMSAKRLPHRDDLIKLLDALKTAKRPILVHCKAGVDRTGEAAAIYKMLYMGASKEEALEMLSGEFGHFENIMPAKRYFIRDVWRGERWARSSYDPCSGNYKHYDVNDSRCSGSGTDPGDPGSED